MDLVENETDVNVQERSWMIEQILDDDKRTPLHWAASSKNPELVRYLLSVPNVQVNAQDEVSFRLPNS